MENSAEAPRSGKLLVLDVSFGGVAKMEDDFLRKSLGGSRFVSLGVGSLAGDARNRIPCSSSWRWWN